MSGIDFRDAIRQRIAIKLRGDGVTTGGIEATILSGAPKDYPTYRDMTGYYRAYYELNELLDEVWHDLYDPKPAKPEPEQK